MMISKIGAYSDMDLSLVKINVIYSRKYVDQLVHEQKSRSDNGIVLVFGGRATYYRDKQESMAVEKDQIFFLKQGSQYRRVADPEEPFEFILISYTLSDEETSLPFSEVNPVGNPAYYRAAFYEILDVWTRKRLGYKLRCNAIMHDICYHLANDVVGRNLNDRAVAKLNPAIEYMEKHYRSLVTVEELASRTNLSVSYFHRIFRETYGTAPLQYMISIRVDIAKDLIRSGLYSIGEVAEKVGYDDIYYFSRIFKKTTGLSPTEYYKSFH
ncbi:MAG: transcriptional regulator, AraC family [Paenibacillaceae bacterium]|jgi:AraC-like DNA-binding protein|nr:transcriptional regulator, AraC family [Paenibacillaceae bacterium]